MARLANSGTYVYLDDAAVFLDLKQNRLHITSNDRDIPGNGIHINVRPGTQTEVNLRGLLEKFDVPMTRADREARAQKPIPQEDLRDAVARIDHSEHDHPATPEARAACRAAPREQELENGFKRLPTFLNADAERRSKHHRRESTWQVSYPLADANLVAEHLAGRKHWRGEELRVAGSRMIASITYGPVLGAYDADLVKRFKEMNVQFTILEPLSYVCTKDCPHRDHVS